MSNGTVWMRLALAGAVSLIVCGSGAWWVFHPARHEVAGGCEACKKRAADYTDVAIRSKPGRAAFVWLSDLIPARSPSSAEAAMLLALTHPAYSPWVLDESRRTPEDAEALSLHCRSLLKIGLCLRLNVSMESRQREELSNALERELGSHLSSVRYNAAQAIFSARLNSPQVLASLSVLRGDSDHLVAQLVSTNLDHPQLFAPR